MATLVGNTPASQRFSRLILNISRGSGADAVDVYSVRNYGSSGLDHHLPRACCGVVGQFRLRFSPFPRKNGTKPQYSIGPSGKMESSESTKLDFRGKWGKGLGARPLDGWTNPELGTRRALGAAAGQRPLRYSTRKPRCWANAAKRAERMVASAESTRRPLTSRSSRTVSKAAASTQSTGLV
jgi:hypothetical protein